MVLYIQRSSFLSKLEKKTFLITVLQTDRDGFIQGENRSNPPLKGVRGMSFNSNILITFFFRTPAIYITKNN